MAIINKKYLSFFIVAIFIVLVFPLIRSGKLGSRAIKEELSSQTNQVNQIHYVKIAGQTVKVTLALTQSEQEQGLSGRTDLPEGEGMLFVFPKVQENYFWMKDMLFPIDIIWMDQNLQIIFIQKNVTPESYPETFGPNQGSKYVLEVPGGFSQKNNLEIGEKVEFLP